LHQVADAYVDVVRFSAVDGRITVDVAYACGHLFWPHARYGDQAEQASYARRLQRALDPAS
jgi:hypothetical protein